MIGKLELGKARAICPPYLNNLIRLSFQFCEQAEYVRKQGDFITSREVGKLFELGYVILEEYLSVINQIKSSDTELIKEIRNDIFTVFSLFFTQSNRGFVKVNWYKTLEDQNPNALVEQITSSIMAFIESRIYIPLMGAYDMSMKDTIFLGNMVAISTRRAGFYPDLKDKPKVSDLFGGGDDDEEKSKKKKKKKENEDVE